jgi:hypothetical protein
MPTSGVEILGKHQGLAFRITDFALESQVRPADTCDRMVGDPFQPKRGAHNRWSYLHTRTRHKVPKMKPPFVKPNAILGMVYVAYFLLTGFSAAVIHASTSPT